MTAELTNLVRWEIFRLVRRAGMLVLASLVLLLGGAALTLALPQVLGAFPFPDKPGYFQAAAGTLASVAPLLAILLAALVHATDLQGGNCRTLAARGTSRTAILGAKFLTCSVALMAYYAAVLGMATLLALLVFAPLPGVARSPGRDRVRLPGVTTLSRPGNIARPLAAVRSLHCRGRHCSHIRRIDSLSHRRRNKQVPGVAAGQYHCLDPLGNCQRSPGQQQLPQRSLVRPHSGSIHLPDAVPRPPALPQARPAGRQRLSLDPGGSMYLVPSQFTIS